MRKFAWAALAAGLLGLAACTAADLEALNKVVNEAANGSGALSESDIAAGLKEALATGTQRAVSRIGHVDGFWKNASLRIPLPGSLKDAAKVLRTFGQGGMVDDFELSLNRAAERAVPEAAGIFGDAIRAMTLADARSILDGGNDAATRYFREKTSAALTARFKPVVGKATDAVGVTRKYKDLAGRAGRLVPGLDLGSLDVDGYVTEHALVGLFSTLGDEEKRIREDPAARSTELLRRVFGR
jgi:hypothetical protein